MWFLWKSSKQSYPLSHLPDPPRLFLHLDFGPSLGLQPMPTAGRPHWVHRYLGEMAMGSYFMFAFYLFIYLFGPSTQNMGLIAARKRACQGTQRALSYTCSLIVNLISMLQWLKLHNHPGLNVTLLTRGPRSGSSLQPAAVSEPQICLILTLLGHEISRPFLALMSYPELWSGSGPGFWSFLCSHLSVWSNPFSSWCPT